MVRKLEIKKHPGSQKGNKGQLIKMISKEHLRSDVSVFATTINTLTDLPKVPKTNNENEGISGVTASPVYRGYLLNRDTLFKNTGSLLKANDGDLLSDYETPVIYLDKRF